MSINQDRINRRIRTTWKIFILFSLIFGIMFGILIAYSYMKEKNYQEKYESSTWREVDAVIDHTSTYTKREQYEDDYIDVEYYAWYFTYQGLDGKTYTYVERGKSFEPSEGFTRTIYVDEHDDSRTLEIRDYSDSGDVIWLIFRIVCMPYVVIFAIVLIVLYVLKFTVKNKQEES